MRQLVLRGPGELAVETVEPSPIAPGQVRVAVHSAGVCSSDVHGYTGANQRRAPGTVMGHEAAGVVVEAAPDVIGVGVGEGVVINPVVSCGRCDPCRRGVANLCDERRLYGCVAALPGAFADEVVVAATNVVAFGGDVPFEWGALCEPLAVGGHAARTASPDVRGRVLVLGGGPIGIGVALGLRRESDADVLVSEPQEGRRAVLKQLGIPTAHPAHPTVAEGGFTAAFDCVASPATLGAALQAVRSRGLVMLVGLGEETLPLPVASLVMQERRLSGSAVYTPVDFAATVAWVASGEADLSPLIESRVTIEDLPDVFRAYADGSHRALRTLAQFHVDMDG